MNMIRYKYTQNISNEQCNEQGPVIFAHSRYLDKPIQELAKRDPRST